MRKKLVPAIWSLVASVLAADPGAVAHNAAFAPAQPGAPRGPGDGVGINATVSPLTLFETESNNTPGTANSIAVALTATRYMLMVGSINPGSDVDVYSFTAAAGSRIWIEADTGGSQGPGGDYRDTVIDLLAADGTTVIETDDEDGTGNGGDGTIETGSASLIAGRTLTAGGTYYIRVTGFAAGGVINPYRLFVVNTTVTAVAEVEANNEVYDSNAVVPVSMTSGLRSGAIAAAGDVDYYSVAATAGSTVFFAADGDPERDGTGTDLVLELRSPANVLLLSVDSEFNSGSLANPSAEGANFTVLSDGVYSIRVRHFSGSGTGTYHLMAAISTPTEDEPNNSAATAELLDFTSSARRVAIINGSISPGDVDFYAFQAAAGSRVWIETDTGGIQKTGATSRDTVIDLLASDGVTVIENDNDDGTGNGGDGIVETGLASMIGGRTLPAGGTYYIRVRAFSATAIIDPYKLFVVLTNEATSTDPETEPNSTAETSNIGNTDAVPIRVRTGAIGSAGDVDYYSVFGYAGSLVYFNVDGDPDRDGTGTDLVIEFRSPTDALLLSVDSSFAGSPTNPAAEGGHFIVTDAAGFYYVKVRHFSATGTGTYRLMVISASGNGFGDVFTDSALFATISTIRAVHFTELRERITHLRARFGLSEFAWSRPSLAGFVVHADDLAELRTALAEAFTVAGLPVPTYIDPVLVPQGTLIRSVHIDQLRNAVIVLESS